MIEIKNDNELMLNCNSCGDPASFTLEIGKARSGSRIAAGLCHECVAFLQRVVNGLVERDAISGEGA